MSDFPKIEGFKILDIAGRGGMSTVYRALQEDTGREVALKLISSRNPEQLEQFSREGEIIASLEHPHILPVYKFDFSEDRPYLVMRLLEGGSLADWVRDGKPADHEDVIEAIVNIAEALDFSHARGVLHRDVKPSNMLLDTNGFVYLSDFGIAMFPSDGESRGLGSAAYISPEQARGEALDGRTDIYSLAVSLFELLTGSKPYTAETPVAVMVKQINEPVPDPRDYNDEISPSVAELIRWGMSKKPDGRPHSAGQLGQLLKYAFRNPEATVRPTSGGVTIPFRTITPPKGFPSMPMRVSPDAYDEQTRLDNNLARTNRWLVILSSLLLFAISLASIVVLVIVLNNPTLLPTSTPVPEVIATEPTVLQPVATEPENLGDHVEFRSEFEVSSAAEDCADGICFTDGSLLIRTTTKDFKLWPVELDSPLDSGVVRVELLPSPRSQSYKVGLFCRLTEENGQADFVGAYFEIAGDKQTVSSFRVKNGDLEIIDSDEVPSDFIEGAPTNTLSFELRCFESTLDFLINENQRPVLSSQVGESVSGTFGVMTANNLDGPHEVRFDNLEVWNKLP